VIELLLYDSTDTFKNRLDKVWFNQDLKFDCKADIAAIGSHIVKLSVFKLCNIFVYFLRTKRPRFWFRQNIVTLRYVVLSHFVLREHLTVVKISFYQ